MHNEIAVSYVKQQITALKQKFILEHPTYHNKFKIPQPLVERTTCYWTACIC